MASSGFFPARPSEVIWDELLAIGKPLGLIPCGLGSRDSFAAGSLLPAATAPTSRRNARRWQLASAIFVDLEKPGGFIGHDALLASNSRRRPGRTPCCLPHDRAKARQVRAHYAIYAKGGSEAIGETTSGNFSPSLEAGIGMAYLPAKMAKPGQAIEIDIRGRRFAAVVEKKPLYKRRADRPQPAGEAA